MKHIINTDYGRIKIKDVMIDIDGTNLEEGIDISQDGEFLFNKVGYSTENMLYNKKLLNEWLYDYTFKS